jgi:hypothetical protein
MDTTDEEDPATVDAVGDGVDAGGPMPGGASGHIHADRAGGERHGDDLALSTDEHFHQRKQAAGAARQPSQDVRTTERLSHEAAMKRRRTSVRADAEQQRREEEPRRKAPANTGQAHSTANRPARHAALAGRNDGRRDTTDAAPSVRPSTTGATGAAIGTASVDRPHAQVAEVGHTALPMAGTTSHLKWVPWQPSAAVGTRPYPVNNKGDIHLVTGKYGMGGRVHIGRKYALQQVTAFINNDVYTFVDKDGAELGEIKLLPGKNRYTVVNRARPRQYVKERTVGSNGTIGLSAAETGLAGLPNARIVHSDEAPPGHQAPEQYTSHPSELMEKSAAGFRKRADTVEAQRDIDNDIAQQIPPPAEWGIGPVNGGGFADLLIAGPARQARARQGQSLRQSTRAGSGARVTVTVPGDGWCLLYSVLVSTPPEEWPGAVSRDTHAQHAAILEQLPRRSEALHQAAEALRAMVEAWVHDNRHAPWPGDVIAPYRNTEQQVRALDRQLRNLNTEQLQARLAELGIDAVEEPEWLSSEVLRRHYIRARVQELTHDANWSAPLSEQAAFAHAESEVPINDRGQLTADARGIREQFGYLQSRSALPTVADLDTEDLRTVARATNVRRPLTPDEYHELLAALNQWRPGTNAWNTSYGEMFPALVAHTLHVRLRDVTTDHVQDVGPTTGRTVDVAYNGVDHYNGTIAAGFRARGQAAPQPITGGEAGLTPLSPVSTDVGGDSPVRSSLGGGDDAVPVSPKREHSPTLLRVERPEMLVQIGALDQARTEFARLRSGAFNVDTNEWGDWEPELDTMGQVQTMIGHHPMDPTGENDLLFPIRDPADPLRRVHPVFADEKGAISSNVHLIDVAPRFQPSFIGLKSGDGPTLARLTDEVRTELTRTIDNSRPDAPSLQPTFLSTRTETRRLTADDGLAEHERMLIDQWGLFVRADVPRTEFTAREGHILGIYMGALLLNKADADRALAALPDLEHYLMQPGSRTRFSGLGGTNGVGFANTPLKVSRRGYDKDRINAVFVTFTVTMTDRDGLTTDRNGRRRAWDIAVLIGLENLQPGQQILVSYGRDYLRLFKEVSTQDNEISTHAKREPPD